MLTTIQVPIFLPIIGLILFIIIGFYLYKIYNKLKDIQNFVPKNINLTEEKIDKNKEELNNDLYKNIITSPMVGTAYLKPSPTESSFVKEGDHIKQGDTVMVIEAMKTYNKIRSPYSGVVKKILITDGKPVEFEEKLIVIE